MGKNKIIDALVKEGKEQGYLTYKKIEKFLADDIVDVNKIEYLYDILSESGIDLVETEEEGNLLVKDKGIEQQYKIISNSKEEPGLYKDAIEVYKQAIRIDPDYAESHIGLGYAYF